MSKQQKILEFWNERSQLGEVAGTNDFILSAIEQDFISHHVPSGSRVLDIGCGNGATIIRLGQERACSGVGIDFSVEMSALAEREVEKAGLGESIIIRNRGVPPIPTEFGTFDVVLSQRCLINLTSTKEQKRAIDDIRQVLNSRGKYIMVESSIQGSARTNEVRRSLGLEPIDPPWHNLFFDEEVVSGWPDDEFQIECFEHITSTYNFLSRIVYAKLAADRHETLRYDSDINLLSMKLPPQIGDFGPVKAWVWRKR